MTGNLTGRYFVRLFDDVLLDEAQDLLPRMKDQMRLRRQSLKLRFWPDHHPEAESGQLLDVNWSYIKGLPGLKIGELRVDEVIGGHDNLRIIFFVGPSHVKDPLPIVWILYAFQKKRDDFTRAQLAAFKARRKAVIERFYQQFL